MIEWHDLTPLEATEKRIHCMSRHFKVSGNKSKDFGRKHFNYSVVCRNMKRAMELTEEAFPGCEILTVADQGSVDRVENA